MTKPYVLTCNRYEVLFFDLATGVATAAVLWDLAGTGVATRVTPWYEEPTGSMAYSARLQLPSVRAQAATATSLAKGEKVFFMGKKCIGVKKYFVLRSKVHRSGFLVVILLFKHGFIGFVTYNQRVPAGLTFF